MAEIVQEKEEELKRQGAARLICLGGTGWGMDTYRDRHAALSDPRSDVKICFLASERMLDALPARELSRASREIASCRNERLLLPSPLAHFRASTIFRPPSEAPMFDCWAGTCLP